MERTLQDFLRALEAAGELHRIAAPVSPILEVAEIADRQSKSACPNVSEHAGAFDPAHVGLGGKALLFENIEGSDFPLAINTYGSYRRMEMALGLHHRGGFPALAERIGSLLKPQPPRSLGEAISRAKQFLPLLRIGPKRRRGRGRCQDVIKLTSRSEVDLRRLPIIKCWPLDGDPASVGYGLSPEQAGTGGGEGRYITLAGMHTIHFDDRDDPKPASHNIGMYRAQLLDATHLAMHWHMHHDGASHWRSWKRAGQRMPIAICLGGESVLPYGATAPLPPGLSELLMAGFLNGRGIEMVRAQTVPLWVPANSEIVIEGWVSTECGFIGFDPRTGEALGPGAVFEGPFGDHTGFYSLPDRYPIVEVTAMTHRRNAVYPTTIVGLPPQEDYYLGKATERIFLPLLKTLIHDIDDYHLPMFGCFHNCAFVRIGKAYPLHARRVMHAIWGAGQMAWTKVIIVVDEDVDVHDESAVLAAIFQHCDFERDIEIVNGPLDILDHAAPRLGAGHKIGIDATPKRSGEEVHGIPVTRNPGARPAGADAVAIALGAVIGKGAIAEIHVPQVAGGRLVIAGVTKDRPGRGGEAIEAIWAALDAASHRGEISGTAGDAVIVVDATVDVADLDAVFFHACANVDPGRDLHRQGSRVAVDATHKFAGDARHGQPVRDYPPILRMSEVIGERVTSRWGEYGFGLRLLAP